MLRPSIVLFAGLLACTASPPNDPATSPASVGPQFLPDLDLAGRRTLCERIVAVRRRACEFPDIDAMLVDQCLADHPRWSCRTLRVDDHERCAVDRDEAACAAAEQQALACDLAGELRRRCPLHVGSVGDGGPAAVAGLRPGDRVRALDGVPHGHTDYKKFLEAIAAADDRPLRLTVESAGRTRDLDVTPERTDGRPRIGVAFTTPPECKPFLEHHSVLPCSIDN